MKAIIHFGRREVTTYFVSGVALALSLASCSKPVVEPLQSAPQAIRSAEVRIADMVQGRTHLGEIVPEQSVRVLAQVPGTITALAVPEGATALYGAPLVRVSAPDVAARVARVRSERKRAQRERDFACKTLKTDRKLVTSGDLSSIQLDRSERACSSAELAVEGAQAGEREASVAKARGTERAPFDGQVLQHLVDVGQTVMPGTPLMQYASRERLLRLRVPASDLQGIKVGGKVRSELGLGHIQSVASQASGPGRLIEVLIQLESSVSEPVGAAVSATLVTAQETGASAVPDQAIAEVKGSAFIMLIEENALRRQEVKLGLRESGWTSVHPPLPKGSTVAVGAISALDPARAILVVEQ